MNNLIEFHKMRRFVSTEELFNTYYDLLINRLDKKIQNNELDNNDTNYIILDILKSNLFNDETNYVNRIKEKKSYLFLKYILDTYYYNDKYNYKLDISNIRNFLNDPFPKRIKINSNELYQITKILSNKYPDIFDDNYYMYLLDKFMDHKHNFVIDILKPSEKLSEKSKIKINNIIDGIFDDLYGIHGNIKDNLLLLINKYYDIINVHNFLQLSGEYYFSTDSLVYDIFNILLTKDTGPDIVFQILDKSPIHSIELADITMTDKDYHPYILKYLNYLITYKENKEKEYKNNLEVTYEDDPQYYGLLENNLDKKAHYLIAQILMNDSNVPKYEIIRHLLKSNNDGRRLGARLIQEHYLKTSISTSLDFLEDNDTDTLVNLLKYIK